MLSLKDSDPVFCYPDLLASMEGRGHITMSMSTNVRRVCEVPEVRKCLHFLAEGI